MAHDGASRSQLLTRVISQTRTPDSFSLKGLLVTSDKSYKEMPERKAIGRISPVPNPYRTAPRPGRHFLLHEVLS